MKTLILPFELIQPIFLNVNYDKMEVDLFRFALRVHDLIRVALSKQYKLVVYFLEPMSEDWAKIYASQIRHHYQMEKDDFFLIPLSSLYDEAFIKDINREESLLFVPKDELGYEIRKENFTNTQEINFDIEPKVLGWAMNRFAPGVMLEKVSDQSLEEMFSLIDQVANDSVTKQMLYHDLEIIITGSRNRNTIVKSLIEYIKSLLKPKFGRAFCYLKSRKIVFPDHHIEIDRIPAQAMAVYYFFAKQDQNIPERELISYWKNLAEYYYISHQKLGRREAAQAIKDFIERRYYRSVIRRINERIQEKLGSNEAALYGIKSLENGYGILAKRQNSESLKCFEE